MLNTKKILFILSDVAYSAELLPDKKPLSFVLQSCVQLNGSFIEDKVLNITNLSKLFAKLDPTESYQVILPDELFINTILSIKEVGDAKIREELKEKVLPSLLLSQETHDISTTVLNELRGTTRVQLSAIETASLAPLRATATNYKIKIENIAPLSWALKSIVSLEPSIVILQLGSMVYGSLHYIGVEQCFSAPSDELETMFEKIKELKKAESSIMTCYLVTNTNIESDFKKGLKEVLPLQQMTEVSKDKKDVAVEVTTIIEASMRTLAIPDFPVPQFSLGKPTASEVEKYAPALAIATADIKKGTAMPNATDDTQKADQKSDTELPKPKILPTGTVGITPAVATAAPAAPAAPAALTPTPKIVDVTPEVATAPTAENKTSPYEESTSADKSAERDSSSKELKTPTETEPVAVVASTISSTSAQEPAIDLRQFAGAQSTTTATTQVVKPEPIKNKSRSMTKMIIITLSVFVGTVALGIGVGMLVLKSASKPATPTPVIEVQAPSPESTPDPAATTSATATGSATNANPSPGSTATVSAAIAGQRILIVNATDKAGYAGQIKDKMTKAGFKSITAGNAKGTYTTAGDFVHQKETDDAILTSFEQASGLGLTSDETAKQEDPQGSYDAVIVLNQ